ncbi:hypothetical protein QCA50_014666 [Cerrena zonata]|uniref:Carotenoid isomerase n=1 Tax=Cerrena zonata TaxID=2478898 RepID=A0AAW0FKX8_9APHY
MSGEPEGTMVDGAYFHEGPNKDYAVILLTDVFGLPLVNNKLLTDGFSKELQCDVWAPHIFNGEPIFRAEDLEPIMPRKVGDKLGFWSILRLIGMFIPHIHHF